MQLFKYFKDSNAWGIEIKTCGYHHATENSVYPPLGHPKEYTFGNEQGRELEGFHVVYIPTGAGFFETAFLGMREVVAGDVIFIYENEWHSYRPKQETGWEEYWVGIDGNYFRTHILNDTFVSPHSYIKSIGYQEDIILTFEQILTLAKRPVASIGKVLSGSILHLLGQLASIESAPHTHKKEQQIEQVIFYIRQNANKTIDFEALADQQNMSYSGFRKFFKKHTGLALNQYHIREQLLLAQRMIRNTDLPLKEIAEKAGFESLFYFSRLYKKKFGSSPSKDR